MIFNKDYLYMGKGAAQTFLPIVQVTGCYTPGTTTTSFSKRTLLNSDIVYPVNCISYVFTNSTNSSCSTTLTVNGETVTTSTSPLVLNEKITSNFNADITGFMSSSTTTAKRSNSSFYFSVPKSNREPDYIIYGASNSKADEEGYYSAQPYLFNNTTKENVILTNTNATLITPGTYFFSQMRNINTTANLSFYIDNTRYYFTGTNSSNTTRNEEITITTGTVRASETIFNYNATANVICLWKK